MSTEPYEESDAEYVSTQKMTDEEESELNNKRNEILTLLKMYGNMKLDSPISDADNEETSNCLGNMNSEMNVDSTQVKTAKETTKQDIMKNLQQYAGLQFNSEEEMDISAADDDGYGGDANVSLDDINIKSGIDFWGNEREKKAHEESDNSTSYTGEDDMILPTHLENTFELMLSRELLIPLIKKLNEVNLLDDFIVMMKHFSEGWTTCLWYYNRKSEISKLHQYNPNEIL